MSETVQCSRCRNFKPVSEYSANGKGRRLQTCDPCRAIKRTRDRRNHSGCALHYRKIAQPEIMGDDKRYLMALRKPIRELWSL